LSDPERTLGIMTEHETAVQTLAALWQLIEEQQWDRMGQLLDPAVAVHYVHTGEVMDADGFIRANRDYPGRWHVHVADMVGELDRAVSRTSVSDGQQTFWVASFATTRHGRIAELVEVWTDAGQSPHPSRAAG